ncbi:MAG TPA: M1 family peptidase [Ignavibacteria bacterium]|nr:M1 family peptidase [Ignavibacteria bacterium]
MMHNSKLFTFKIFIFYFFLTAGFLNPFSRNETHSITNKTSFRLQEFPGFQVNVNPKYISLNQYKIDILHYYININLYPVKKTLKGDVTIVGKLLDKNLKQIDLNFYDNFNISKITLNGNKTKYINKGTRLTIPLKGIQPDTFKIHVVYEGRPKRMGFYGFVFAEINNTSVIYNLNEPDFASTWFPCNDIPSDKAQLDIKITNDSSDVSASNGKLVGITTLGARRTYYWKTIYPISTYLIGLYSSDYTVFKDKYISLNKVDTMDIDYFVFHKQLKAAKIDFKEEPEIINFFAKTFGEYPFIKAKYGIAEFLWEMGAMETQTLTGVGSIFIGGLNLFTAMYVHELAHQWFGDAVGPESWKDIWLNEGFATYGEALFSESKGGKTALQSTMMSKFQDDFTGTVYNPGNIFSTTVYDKGAWILQMLRWEVGDSTFFHIMRSYFNKFKYKNASTADFENVCEQVSHRNLNHFFNQWVYQGTGIIKVKYSWTTKSNQKKFLLKINLHQIQKGYNTYFFPLQIKIIFQDRSSELKTFRIDKRQKLITFNTGKLPVHLIFDPNNWLLAEFSKMQKSNE